jgi:hypothetical protein
MWAGIFLLYKLIGMANVPPGMGEMALDTFLEFPSNMVAKMVGDVGEPMGDSERNSGLTQFELRVELVGRWGECTCRLGERVLVGDSAPLESPNKLRLCCRV